MLEIESEFLDEYKILDKFIKDRFNTESGISSYISNMHNNMYEGKCYIGGWADFLRSLEHIRRIRNSITHDTDTLSCEEEDINLVLELYDAFFNAEDPYTLLINRKKKEQSKRKANSDNYIDDDDTDISFSKLLLILLVIALIVSILLVIYIMF